MTRQLRNCWLVCAASWLLTNGDLEAQVTTGFEPPAYAGSATGTLLTGQNGWYVPIAGSPDANVFTYAGNSLGLPANPTGATQFVGGVSGGTVFSRAQLDIPFTNSQWTFSTDVAHRYNGTLPTAQNLGSFSVAHPTLVAPNFRQLIGLHTWVDLNTATNWNMGYLVFDAAGVAIGAANVPQSPGAEWNNLLVDNWYRESWDVDFSTNQVMALRITNLTTGITTTANPVGWFLAGGAAGTANPLPTAVRYFAGGAVGNVAGWDNLSVQPIPEPTSIALVAVGLLGTIAARRRNRGQHSF